MITILISVILFIIIYLIYDEHETPILFAMIATGFSLGLLIATILGDTSLSDKEVRLVVKNTTHISSIADGANIQGRFMLGSGTIEGVPCYVYYVGNDIKGYKIARIKAENVVIKEEQNCTPRIVYNGWKRIKPFFKSFLIIPRIIHEDEVTIYVPKGTIIRNFVLDSNL